MNSSIDTGSWWIRATLALRLAIEVGMFAGIVVASIANYDGLPVWIVAAASVVTVATLWGVFAVPGDPSRSGKTVVKTPGAIRLVLELGLFGTVSAWLVVSEVYAAGATLGIATAVHYASWPARIRWLLAN